MVDLRRRDLHLNNILDLIVKCSVAREDPRHLHKIASKLVKKLATLVVGHPPTSTSRTLHGIIHMISVHRTSPFLSLFHFHVITVVVMNIATVNYE